MIFFSIILSLVIGFLITRPFTTFFHEWGHALSFLAFTGKGSDIFIGSYGDKKKSFRIPLAGMNVWFNKNPLRWQYGLCDPHATNISSTGRWVSALAGVIFSLLAAIVFTWLAFAFDWHGAWKLIFIFAIGSAGVDILINLRPAPIPLADGRTLFTDGFILQETLGWKKNRENYMQGVKLFEQKKYREALQTFESVSKKSFAGAIPQVMVAHSHIELKQYAEAEQILILAEREFGKTTDILLGYGWLYASKNDMNLAINYLKQGLELEPENTIVLNNLGYQLIKLKRYAEAIPHLDKAISLQPDFAYAFNNRGHARIESGEYEEGLQDVEESIRLNDQNSYAYMNKGVYFLRTDDKQTARKWLEHAKELDAETELLDEYLKLL